MGKVDVEAGGREGKIKAGGTLRARHAGKLLSAHWLGGGARHRPEGGIVPRLAKSGAIPANQAALHIISRSGVPRDGL